MWQLFAYACQAWRGISAAVFNCDKQVYHSHNTILSVSLVRQT